MLFIFKHKIPSKKNSRQLLKKKNKLISLPSKNYKLWNKYIKDNIYNITIIDEFEDNNLFFYKDKKNLKVKAIFNPKDNRKFDLTNTIQSIEDTLNDLNIISDDNFKILSNFNYRVENLDSDIFLILEIDANNNMLFENNNIEIVDYNKILNLFKNNNISSLTDFVYKKKNNTKRKNNKKSRVLYNPEF